MRTQHLQHSELGIRCTGCGERFEIPARVLKNPEQLLECKEHIAQKHSCTGPRVKPEPLVVRPQAPTKQQEGIDASYWDRAIRSMMTA